MCQARSVAHQSADFGIVALPIDCRDRMACCQLDRLDTPGGEHGIGADEQCIGPLAHESCEGRLDLTARADIDDLALQAHGNGSRFNVSHHVLSNRGIAWINEHGNPNGLRAAAHAAVPTALQTTQSRKKLAPVRLPPGRARLATRPRLTGSSPAMKTMGI